MSWIKYILIVIFGLYFAIILTIASITYLLVQIEQAIK